MSVDHDEPAEGPALAPRACSSAACCSPSCSPASSAATRAARPTAWRRSPATRASSSPVATARFAGSPLADYAVRGIDDERLAGGLAGVIGVAASPSRSARCCSGPEPAGAPRSARRPRTGSSRWARVTRTPCTSRGRSPLHRCRRSARSRRSCCSSSSSSARRPARSGPSAPTPALLLAVVLTARLSPLLVAAPHGRRGPVRGLRPAAAGRHRRRAGRRARPVAVRVRAARRVQHPGQGLARRRRQRRARLDHHDPRPAARARAAAPAAPARADRVLHGPLRRRARRRDGPHEGRPRVPRLHRDRAARLAGAVASRSARCSCGPTSAASGSTWPCARAASTARCRSCAAAPPARRSGPPRSSLPAAAGVVAVSAALADRDRPDAVGAAPGRRHPPLPRRSRGAARRRPRPASPASARRCSGRTAPARPPWCCT